MTFLKPREFKEMMDKITLKLFWVCMLGCASLVVVGVWFGSMVPEELFQAAATLFIVGLASFLLWVPMITYRFLNKLS